MVEHHGGCPDAEQCQCATCYNFRELTRCFRGMQEGVKLMACQMEIFASILIERGLISREDFDARCAKMLADATEWAMGVMLSSGEVARRSERGQ